MNPPPLTDAQCELLQLLVRHGKADYVGSESYWSHHQPVFVGSVADNIDLLVRQGSLERIHAGTALAQKFRLSELQSLLKSRGIEPSGRKADLGNQIAERLPPDDVGKLLAGAKRYIATATGKIQIDAYDARKAAERTAMQSNALAALLMGNARNAGQIVADFESRQVFKRGMGIGWGGGIPSQIVEQADYLLKHPFDDLPFTENVRRAIGSELALVILLGEKVNCARILSATGGTFSCQPLEDFLRNDPCGSLAIDSYDDDDGEPDTAWMLEPAHLAFVYGQTRLSEAMVAASLSQMIELGKEGIIQGIEILPTAGNCRICNKNEKRRFRLSELDRLPKIPRHWGCTCCYISW